MIPFSILDLAPIIEGSDAGEALRNSLDLAKHVEALGYRRYWMAEHHNLPASRARRPRSRSPTSERVPTASE